MMTTFLLASAVGLMSVASLFTPDDTTALAPAAPDTEEDCETEQDEIQGAYAPLSLPSGPVDPGLLPPLFDEMCGVFPDDADESEDDTLGRDWATPIDAVRSRREAGHTFLDGAALRSLLREHRFYRLVFPGHPAEDDELCSCQPQDDLGGMSSDR